MAGINNLQDVKQKEAAKKFAAEWKGEGYEKGQSQVFWMSLLHDVFGVENPKEVITFENQIKLNHTSFIDGYISETKVLIEQKSLGVNLRAPIKQSDGSLLTPFQQAKRYASDLPHNKNPRWIVTCNFSSFLVYDMNHPHDEPEEILLENLPDECYRLNFLVNKKSEHIKKEIEVSVKAGELIGKLYDAFATQYKDLTNEYYLKSLNVLCVRLVFCLYAEDAGIFDTRSMFRDYLADFKTHQMRRALIDLFEVLNTPLSKRDTFLEKSLADFPFVNGGLFAKDDIEIPNFTDEIRELLLVNGSEEFDWSKISPTIFGAVFESTLNPETRRSGGMHYTSIENIHKVIDPLFLNDLRNEWLEIQNIANKKKRFECAEVFQNKLASLKFLDPACGSGNFLTETYMSLRKLENEILMEQLGVQIVMGDLDNKIKVSISQFYGIEINDFAVTVAKTALWIAENQMMKATEAIIHMKLDFLPLKTNAYIVEGNALRIDWESVVPKKELNYIMGNPPFVGASMMSKEQKAEAVEIFGKGKRVNSIDYVGAWYYKAAQYIQGTEIGVSFVSTNSITQGEQVAPLWKNLFDVYKIHIDFAYRTFKWNNEASDKAAVHCVIIGFSVATKYKTKLIFTDNVSEVAQNINPYLVDAPVVFVQSRSTSLCAVPKLTAGNKPTDGGNLILSEDERIKLIEKDKSIEPYIRRYLGSKDFINNNEIRYCLWLKGVSPSVYRKNSEVMRRLQAVKEMRLNSSAAPTRALADKPYLFFSTPQNDSNYLCIPEVSSENRRYIPIGFQNKDVIASNKLLIVPEASLYHFGVLTSNVHMSWMRCVTGRLEMRYQYSGSVVYNTFPWCNPTETQRAKIEKTAQAILDARALYPDSSLADLYDEVTMPKELRQAHRNNDRAVMEAYGFWGKLNTESECVAELMKMYQKLVEDKK